MKKTHLAALALALSATLAAPATLSLASSLPTPERFQPSPEPHALATQVDVAAIASTGYATLNAAVAAAPVNTPTTIKLVADAVLTTTLEIPANKNITIELNNHSIHGGIAGNLITNKGTLTFNGSGNVYNQEVSARRHHAVYNEGTLTVNGGTFGDADNDRTNANPNNRGAALFNTGTATINRGFFTDIDNNVAAGVYAYAIINEGGTLTINDATVYGKMHGCVANGSGTVVINDGEFKLSTSAADSYYAVFATNNGTVSQTVINGGTFNGAKGGVYADVDDAPADDKSDLIVLINGGTFSTNSGQSVVLGPQTSAHQKKFTITGGQFSTDPTTYVKSGYTVTGTGPYQVTADSSLPVVASVGTRKFPALQDAVDAALDGETVTLEADVALTEPVTNSVSKSFTLDLNDHHVTLDATYSTTERLISLTTGKLSVLDSSTGQSGSMNSAHISDGVFFVGENATLNVSGLLLKNDAADNAAVLVDGGTVNLTGTTVTSTLGGLGLELKNNATATLTNCTLSQTGATGNAACVVAGGASTLTVNGTGSYSSDAHALFVPVSGATVSLAGGTFNGAVSTIKTEVQTNSVNTFVGKLQATGGTYLGTLDIGALGQNYPRIMGGLYAEDPTAYLPASEGFAVTNSQDAATPYLVERNIANATVAITGGNVQAYTGTAVKPAVTVTAGSTVLTKGVDYTLEYNPDPPVGPGKVEVTLTGIDPTVGTKKVEYRIACDLSAATIAASPSSYIYSAEPVVPTVTVSSGSYTVPSSDYTVTATGNVNAGTPVATVAATADGSATGSATCPFTIFARDLGNPAVTTLSLEGGTKQALGADGMAPRPRVLFADAETGKELALSSSDYTLTYQGQASDGSYKVLVTGVAPNCTGSATLSFDVSSTFEDAEVEVADQIFTGKAVKPASSDVEVRIGSSTISPSLYTYTVTNNAEPGTAGIVVTPKASSGYSGVKVGTFRVVGDLAQATVTLDKSSYDLNGGDHVEPVATVRLGTVVCKPADLEITSEVYASAGVGVLTVKPKADAPYENYTTTTFTVTNSGDPDVPSKPETADTPGTPDTPDEPEQVEPGPVPMRSGDTAEATVEVTASGEVTTRLTDFEGNPAQGWVVAGGDTYYAVDGVARQGETTVGDKTYVFSTSGKLRTGIITDVDGSVRYAAEEAGKPAGTTKGEVVKNGWVEVDGTTYRAGADGTLLTGWYDDPATGAHYYLYRATDAEPTGSRATDCWFYVPEEDGWYVASASGAILTGWVNDPATGERYHLNAASKVDGVYGKLDSGWLYDAGNWYYLFRQGEEGVYGSVAKNGWLWKDNQWYLCSESGAIRSGWYAWGGNWYFFTPTHDGLFGAMQTGWIWDGSGWYWADASGAIHGGWVFLGDGSYWLTPDHNGLFGRMQTGWIWDGWAWYYMGWSGAMLTNAWTPDGYYVGVDGRCVW